MDTLLLKETVEVLAKANRGGLFEHGLRRRNDSVLKVVLDLTVSGKNYYY